MANYTTVQKVKDFVGKSSDGNITTKITNALPWVDRLINRQTGREFLTITITSLKLQATGLYESQLILYDHAVGRHLIPIISLSLVKEGGATLVENTDFFVNKAGGFIEKNQSTVWLSTGQGYWSPIARDIEIAGTFGYAVVPADIEAAATEMTAIIVLEKTKTFDTAEGVSTSVMTKFPEYVQETLNAYRVVTV